MPAGSVRAWLLSGSRALLAVAVCCLAVFVAASAERSVSQYLGERELDAAIRARAHQGEGATAVRSPRRSVGRVLPNPDRRPFRPSTVGPGRVVGKLEIPRLKASAVIREGVDDRTLGVAVGLLPETARPGEVGNVALAGHRDTLFRPLRRVKLGDEIVLRTPDDIHRYVVEATNVVEPSAVEVLDDIGQPVLTLITCYPFDYIGAAPKRFIVRARQLP